MEHHFPSSSSMRVQCSFDVTTWSTHLSLAQRRFRFRPRDAELCSATRHICTSRAPLQSVCHPTCSTPAPRKTSDTLLQPRSHLAQGTAHPHH
jgi:hypothetical protein